MKQLKAFLQIIRWQNLLFITITQWLFHICILAPNLLTVGLKPQVTNIYLIIIIFASVVIAASGNIINDYFDLNIDKINKPDRLIVDKFISRRWVIFWHLLLSLIGIMCSVYVGMRLNLFWLGVANSFCVLLLFIYSASLKKQFLIGNIVVSVLTSWVILVLILPEYEALNKTSVETLESYYKILRIGILYASFSFIISLIREVIKDAEDIDGDRKNGCKTMPIMWGLNATKVFVAVWLIVLIAVVAIAQLYVVRFKWWVSIAYSLILIIAPLVYIFKKLIKAQSTKDFHKLSSLVKWVMLSGILSMIFFWIYER
ncbi:MAG: geranylgeranylglycerol-phosphate geranylgeranyltransferase [Chitinophagaceae bacterium]